MPKIIREVNPVNDYKHIYIRLFSRTEDAIMALENNRVKEALQILISAQQEAEESIVQMEDE